MKKFVLRTYGKIIAWVLTALGLYTSCDIIEPRVEYGSPSADFVVKGNVSDMQNLQPIEDMAVIRKSRTAPHWNDTVRTDANGNYELEFTEVAFGAEDIWVYTSDIDKGEYQSDTIRINASELRQIGKRRKNWYNGKFEGKADFKLKKESGPHVMYGTLPAEYKEMKKDVE
jgi:putative lipoprotein (rSAM/lipoprotein system)